MKNIIINVLVLILALNIVMIIFPEGKTQKFCKLTLKIFIMIYIINNIFLNGGISFEDILNDMPTANNSSYEREINVSSVDKDFISSINNNSYGGREVIKDITINFTENMDLTAIVKIDTLYSLEESEEEIITEIASILKINTNSIVINR